MKDTEKALKFNENYRPSTFREVVGQKGNLVILNNSIIRNEVQNAYIIYGPPGTGKTTVGRIFANKLICLNRDKDNEPCGECDACIDFKNDPFTAGVIEIDGASNATINEIRALKTTISYAPKYGYNIVIIDEAQDVKGPGASALLKVLEEPPANTVFILATTDYESILEAIRSRCMPLFFEPVNPKDIKAKLLHICLEQNIKITERAIDLLSEGVNGCVRDSLKILQQASLLSGGNIRESDLKGLVNMEAEYTKRLIHLMIQGDTVELMTFIDNNVFNVVSSDFNFIAKRIRKALFSKKNVSTDIKRHLIKVANIFLTYKRDISLYANPSMALEFASVESAIYIEENISNKNDLFKLFADKEDVKKKKETVSINKKDLFLNMLYLSDSELEEIFKSHDISLDSTGSILKFLVNTDEDKNKLRAILSSEIPQRIKPMIELEGFVVKLKSDN